MCAVRVLKNICWQTSKMPHPPAPSSPSRLHHSWGQLQQHTHIVRHGSEDNTAEIACHKLNSLWRLEKLLLLT
jgi:hypothetical protein